MSPTSTKRLNLTLWILQAILAAVFLFAGGMKLVVPAATLAKETPLPVSFLRFIGVCEVCGALGLILPGLFRIRERLTPLAAGGLTIIMTGAVIVTVTTSPVTMAILPLVVGVLTGSVAYGRTVLV
jgi:hypothetical protein